MLRSDKQTLIADLRRDFDRAQGVLFVDYTGLTVFEANAFRRKLQKSDIRYVVTKNTLLKKALEGRPYADSTKGLKGTPTGVIFGFEDPVTSAKVVFEFLKDCQHLKIKGGVTDAKSITPAEAETLSKLPSKAEILGTIVSLAKSPGAKLVGQIKGPAGKVLGAIEALAKKLEGQTA
jgi:large subunit ribosomal protein L10